MKDIGRYDLLSPGSIYKNYRHLCKDLNIEPYKGRPRNLHLQRLSKHVDFEKIDGTNQIRVNNVYTGNILEFSHGYYAQHIQPLILCALLDVYKKDSVGRIKMSLRQIARLVPMFNEEYAKNIHRQSTLAAELNMPIADVSTLYNMYEARMRKHLMNALEDLSDRGYIKLRKVLMQSYMGDNKQKNREVVASSEKDRIESIYKRVLSRYGMSSEYGLHLNGKLKSFRDDLVKETNEEFKTDNILYHYEAYSVQIGFDIAYDEQLVQHLYEERLDHEQQLNAKLVEKTKKFYISSRDNAATKLETQMYDMNEYQRDNLLHRVQDFYIANGELLVDTLIKINSS